MAFVYEELTEQDKKYIESFKFKDPFNPHLLAEIPRHCSSNREEEIFLICLGGQGYRFIREYPPFYYRLIWKKEVIEIIGYENIEGNMKIGISVSFDIAAIYVPNTLHIDKFCLIENIKQAFEAYGKRGEEFYYSVEFVSFPNQFW